MNGIQGLVFRFVLSKASYPFSLYPHRVLAGTLSVVSIGEASVSWNPLPDMHILVDFMAIKSHTFFSRKFLMFICDLIVEINQW